MNEIVTTTTDTSALDHQIATIANPLLSLRVTDAASLAEAGARLLEGSSRR